MSVEEKRGRASNEVKATEPDWEKYRYTKWWVPFSLFVKRKRTKRKRDCDRLDKPRRSGSRMCAASCFLSWNWNADDHGKSHVNVALCLISEITGTMALSF